MDSRLGGVSVCDELVGALVSLDVTPAPHAAKDAALAPTPPTTRSFRREIDVRFVIIPTYGSLMLHANTYVSQLCRTTQQR